MSRYLLTRKVNWWKYVVSACNLILPFASLFIKSSTFDTVRLKAQTWKKEHLAHLVYKHIRANIRTLLSILSISVYNNLVSDLNKIKFVAWYLLQNHDRSCWEWYFVPWQQALSGRYRLWNWGWNIKTGYRITHLPKYIYLIFNYIHLIFTIIYLLNYWSLNHSKHEMQTYS